MVAEDSSFVRDTIKTYLTNAGYINIETFDNGKEAWDRINSYLKREGDITKYVDLLITDIEMPLMDGQHLVKRIRGEKKLKDLPIIIFSSISNEVIKRRSLAIGASGQISKPELPKLVDMLDDFLLKNKKRKS